MFYKAEVYIDDELNVPIRYVAYLWPKTGRRAAARRIVIPTWS